MFMFDSGSGGGGGRLRSEVNSRILVFRNIFSLFFIIILVLFARTSFYITNVSTYPKQNAKKSSVTRLYFHPHRHSIKRR